MQKFNYLLFSFLALLTFSGMECGKKTLTTSGSNNNSGGGSSNTSSDQSYASYWLTRGDQSALLLKQPNLLFTTTANSNPTINIDTSITYQTVDGFGYTLTDGSAGLINQLSVLERNTLLKELFGRDSSSIDISYLRISIGASDLSTTVYSYDDMPSGQTDESLQNFSLRKDMSDVVPVLKQILAINPDIKILGSPWSPPAWMKDNNSTKGGSLRPEYYSVYANYFVKYIQAMKAEGITIDAITPQNEPLNPDNNPSLYMTDTAEGNFIKNALGPAFLSAGLTTKIQVWDHNCDHPEYPMTILKDPGANPFVDGSAFHLYAGDISALSQVHYSYPNKNVYFTEQWTSSNGDFASDLKWAVKNVVIGSMRNWSKNALEWNLANDPSFQPHTAGGCTMCKGALTIGNGISRNVSYYIIAHASKFVPAGSVRVASDIVGSLNNVAFKRPDGKKVLIVENDGTTTQSFNIKFNNKWVLASLNAGDVATYVF